MMGIVSKTGSGLTAPKYYRIKMYIIQGIESGEYKAGGRLPSENELSRLFEVNQNTAKKALRELELEKYIYRVQGKGSYVASPDETTCLTGTIALLVNNVDDIFYSRIVKYINNEATNQDCHLIFCNTQQSFEILKKNITEMLNNKKIDGFIAIPAELSNNPEEYKFYQFLKGKGVHFVLLYPQKEIDFANT
ncbi:MAG: GntR family transcriptional regulator, partial [Victivallales bacterium]|nr:GntR family transcriptional regulator [Victivallales bacterium]